MQFLVYRVSNQYDPECELAYKNKNGDYVVNINSLDDILLFSNKYGELVLSNYDNIPSITIYDYYLE